jgi:hypothetical protein
MGDEMPPEPLTQSQLKKVFGPGQYPDAGSTKDLIKAVSERYKVFHVIVEQGSYARGSNVHRVRSEWVNLLGPNVINLSDYKLLPDVIVATLKIASGTDINQVLRESQIKKELQYAFSNALES